MNVFKSPELAEKAINKFIPLIIDFGDDIISIDVYGLKETDIEDEYMGGIEFNVKRFGNSKEAPYYHHLRGKILKTIKDYFGVKILLNSSGVNYK